LRLGCNPLRNLAALRRQSQYRAPRFSLAENFCLWEESIFAETL
jgi:hypothetical protein